MSWNPSTNLNFGRRLQQLGYLWDLTTREAELLKPSDQRFQQALLEYQRFMSLDYQWAKSSQSIQIRTPFEPVDFDGLLGPASEVLMHVPSDPGADRLLGVRDRCRFPDHMPPYITQHGGVMQSLRELYKDPELADSIASILRHKAEGEATSGSGSWPKTCHPDLQEQFHVPGRHVVTIYFDRQRMPARYRDNAAEIERTVFGNLASIGVLLVYVHTPQEADIRLQWRNGAGWIGLAQFNSQRCNDWVFLYMDPGYTPQNIALLMQLLAHELGHNMNLGHDPQSRGNVMSPSITIPSDGHFRGFVPGDRSYDELVRYFGGDPIVINGPGPGPQPDGGVDLQGALQCRDGDYRVIEAPATVAKPPHVKIIRNDAGREFWMFRDETHLL